MQVLNLLLLALFLLLGNIFLNAILLKQKGEWVAWISLGISLSLIVITVIILVVWDGVPLNCSWHWFSLGDWEVSTGIYFNNTAALMLSVLVLVVSCIHCFSLGYMRNKSFKSRYFTGLSFLTFSMAGIILSDNLIMIFVFWELVGFSSYVLISHDWKNKSANIASKKVFIVNRLGDLGFLIGIIGCYYQFGTVNLMDLANLDPALENSTNLALLIACGFVGKSAQFPLQVWLPHATAGPTPVSALIHTVTTVAAGVYLIVRVFFLFPPEALQVILWSCVGMSVYASLVALVERDIKKILSYSTLAQLGIIGVALGLGFPGLALFYISCHAFFKALLFLASGSVIIACDQEQDIFRMGGLWKKMPLTTATFLVGLIGLCGVVFISIHPSKGGILQASYLYDRTVFYFLLFFTFMTSVYMGRLFWIVFMGSANSEKASQACESSWIMRIPLVVLALFSIASGYSHCWPSSLSSVFGGELDQVQQEINSAQVTGIFLFLGIALWVFALVGTRYFYGLGAKEDKLEQKVGFLYRFLANKLWIDSIYQFYVDRIQQRIAHLLNILDLLLIGGFLVRGIAVISCLLGMGIRLIHSVNRNYYVYWVLLSMVLLAFFSLG